MIFNFRISHNGPVSDQFWLRETADFQQAAAWVRQLPYRRNQARLDPLVLFLEGYGTCSTKHAALRRLAGEQQQDGVQLCMGMFRMNRDNTPRVAAVLDRYGLAYIPEAHNYLRIDGAIYDATRPGASAADFEPELMEECIISPDQIGEFKVNYHKMFINRWLEQMALPYNAGALWTIREACIAALSR
ncbi:hypothetical protein [Taibaiella koreensis]|uniref:hypothetical protein n=1 Tax=Taibaiella koreensis TaxID=1268548 RepID=UPI000E5A09D7|nr:hypothetical protein [Taibaiella koreensis]